MINKMSVIFLFLASFAFGNCNIPELEKFESKTNPVLVFNTKKEVVKIDVKRLMRKTIMIESNCNPDIKSTVAKGITQIEPGTFKRMSSDKNFRKTFQRIEKNYEVNLKKDWATDTYTNIVAAYAVYKWKMNDVPRWWNIRYKFTQLKNNFHDLEWNLYKVYFNSIAGKTTLKKWNRYEV
ncbi:MAG: hypothetical protein ACRCTS_05650 [Fusobacteriaceae bacterium]